MTAFSDARMDIENTPPTENLWQKLLRDSSFRTRLPLVNLLVVGDQESGKSALLSRINEGNDKTDTSPSHPPSGSLLSYTTMHILDPKAKESGTADATDDIIAHIHTWTLNDMTVADLIQVALKPQILMHTIAAIVVDLSRPWTIKNALEQWSSTLEGQLLHLINQLPVDQRSQHYHRVKDHWLAYDDPSIGHSLHTTMDVSMKKDVVEEGALVKNFGIPLIIIVTKSDLLPENSVKMDYIEYILRQFAIKYGAAIFYTSAKAGTNVDALRQYLLHRGIPTQFKFEYAPQLVERGAICVPAGYDSFELVNQSLVGSQPKWPNDKPFEKIVPPPQDEGDDQTAASLSLDAKIDSHEQWLEKLEKAAGAGLEELQKQSVEASKKAEAATAARRAAAERRKREEKDVSSTHLANFFNNLLSRPEKSKSGRALDVKKKEKSDQNVKNLAEQELLSLVTKRAPPSGTDS